MTEFIVRHQSRPRLYIRRFDHEEAKRRVDAGESISAIAREYGVHPNAIRQAIKRMDPAKRAAEVERVRAWRTTVCEECGSPAMALIGSKLAHNPDGRLLCQRCRRKAMRTIIRETEDGIEIRCFTCGTWKLADEFQAGRDYRDLRPEGFHRECRSCSSARRRAYRNRNKVPCKGGCGRFVEGKGRESGHTGLCLTCWHAAQRRSVA